MSNFKKTQITNDGYALLSKVLAGTAELKYTRIAIGDGKFEGEYYNELKELINEKLESGIDSVKVNGDGSATIGCKYSNVGLSEVININEIGLFADDPDVGEILYSYTVADGNSNFIGPSQTTVVFEDLEIQTYISSVENITANVVMPLNARNVELEVEGIDANNVQEGFKEIKDKLDGKNLFLNSNFNSNARINQRAQNVYYGNGYTIDRWKITNVNAEPGVKLVLEEECIKLESTTIAEDVYSDYRQSIEIAYANSIAGKTITVRVDFEASEGCSFLFFADGMRSNTLVGDGVRKTLTFTYTFGTSSVNYNNLFVVQLHRNLNCNVGDYIRLYSIKCELGKKATSLLDNDHTIELLKCQRYYIRQRHVGIACTADNHGQMLIPFNANMRIRPVVTFLNDVYAHNVDGSEVRLLLEAGFSKTGNTIRPLNGECVYLSTGDGSNIEGIQNGIYTLNQSGVLGNTVSGDFIVELNAEL